MLPKDLNIESFLIFWIENCRKSDKGHHESEEKLCPENRVYIGRILKIL